MTLIASVIREVLDFFYSFLERQQNHWNDRATEKYAEKVSKKVVAQQVGSASLGKPRLTWPVVYRPSGEKMPKVTSHFGWRTLPNSKRNYHNGTDYKTRFTEGIAVEDCIVKKILQPDSKYPATHKYKGKARGWQRVAPQGRAWTPYVIVVGIHSGRTYVYKHIKPRRKLKVGMQLSMGVILGRFGNYGFTFGPHCHFEWITKLGIRRNPHKMLLKYVTDAQVIAEAA